jgi:YgiT-type zinc finger domain-containing protein
MLSPWGEIDPRRVTAENWWGDSPALVQNVPALVCRNCGEVYFEADVCRKLDELRAAPPSALKIPAAASRRKHVAPASRR